jgi:hypothetical protein
MNWARDGGRLVTQGPPLHFMDIILVMMCNLVNGFNLSAKFSTFWFRGEVKKKCGVLKPWDDASNV